MNSIQTREECLNRLEASLNSIFTHVGSVFHSTTSSDSSEKLAKTRARVHTVVPVAVDNLNSALDVLQGDLTRTRAVLTRDLQMHHSASSKAQAPPLPDSEALPHQDIAEEPQNSAFTSGAHKNDKAGPSHVSKQEVTLIDPPSKPQPESQQKLKANEAQPAASMPPVDGKKEAGQQMANNGIEQKNKGQTATAPSGNTAQTIRSDRMQAGSGNRAGVVDDEAKDEQAEPSPGNDFSSLLPGLDMYASDPSGDAIGGLDSFNDMEASNTFDMANSAEAENNPFGNAEDTNQFGGEVNFDDIISFDNTGGEGDGQGGLEEFDENFFTI